MTMFSIDGIDYDVKCKIVRKAEMSASQISGMLLNRSFFNDVIGTFLQYDISISIPLHDQDNYSALYETLTKPIDGHICIIPYNNGRLTITGRIVTVSDEYVRLPGSRAYWRNTAFSIIANHPSKQMALSQVLVRGRTPMPEAADVEEGTMYAYTGGGWVRTAYADADSIAY